jgi:hypothetical protein
VDPEAVVVHLPVSEAVCIAPHEAVLVYSEVVDGEAVLDLGPFLSAYG